MGKTLVYNTGNPEPPGPGKLELTYGIFFDGTRNNMENTKIRKKVERKESSVTFLPLQKKKRSSKNMLRMTIALAMILRMWPESICVP
jgi:hypothetical protein